MTGAGHVIAGGVPSKTVMTCVQVAELPQTSVAMYVRVKVKRLTHVWFVMTSPPLVTVTTPPQLSEAVMEPGAGAGTKLAHETVMGAGHVNVGGVSSKTTMISAQVAVLPHSSVAI